MKEKIKKIWGVVKAMWYKPLPGRFLTLKEAGAFGIYALGNSWIYNSMLLVVSVTQIPYYYKIDSLHGYLVYIFGTLLASILTPLVGNAMEKKRTKWGRYKPYILFSLPIFALFTMLAMWIPRDAGYTENALVAYVYISCVPLIAIATFCNNMYQTMPSVITPNSQERADIMTPVGLFVGFAPTIMGVIEGPIRAACIANGQGEFMAMRYIGLIAVVIGAICIMFIVKVKERVYELEQAPEGFEVKTDFSGPTEEEAVVADATEESSGEQSQPLADGQVFAAETPALEEEAHTDQTVVDSGISAAAAIQTTQPNKNKYQGLKDFFSLFKNVPLMLLFLALLFGSLREFHGQFRNLLIQLRFDADVTMALNISGVPKTIIGFGSTVGMLLLPLVTRKFNKNVVIIIFSAVGCVICATLGFVGVESIPVGMPSTIVLTILIFIVCINPTYLLVPVMLGEIADWQQVKTGKRYEGHIQNFIFTIPSCFTQIAMLLAWIWQNAIGFEPAQISADIDSAIEAINAGAQIDPSTIVSDSTRALANEWFNAAFLISAASMLLMIIILCFYPLSKKKHAELVAQLESEAVNMDEMEKGNKEEFEATVNAEIADGSADAENVANESDYEANSGVEEESADDKDVGDKPDEGE